MSTPQQERRLRVFLCHASGDKPAVRDLYHLLRADGFSPWLDEEELLPGQHWQEEIPAAVRACDIVVVCLSQKSISKEGYLQREIREALSVAEEKPEGTIFIIPARLEPVDVPKRLSHWQWANLFEPNGYQRLVRALNIRARAIGLTVAASASAVTSAVTQMTPKPPTPQAAVRVEQEKPAAQQVLESPPQPSAAAKPGSMPANRQYHDRFWNQKKNWYLTAILIALVTIAVLIALRHNAIVGSLSAGAMCQEGDKYYLAKDYQQARQWYEQAAADGNADAMNRLGWLYDQGQGVTQDYQQARHWYEKAAATGSAEAMYRLGWFYENGNGMARDYQQARQWYEKGAAAGNADAMDNLGWLYDQGQGVPQDYHQARQWFEKAAAAGNGDAMYHLGLFYEHGNGMARDYQQARQWYEKAAAAGDLNAKKRLEELPK